MIFSWNLGVTVSLILKKIYFCGQNIVTKKLHHFFVFYEEELLDKTGCSQS